MAEKPPHSRVRWLPQRARDAGSPWFLPPSFPPCCRLQQGSSLIPAPRGAENPPLLRVPVCPTAFKDANPATVRGRVSATLTRRNRSLEIPQASWGFRVYVSGSRHTWALPASYPRPSTAEGRSGWGRFATRLGAPRLLGDLRRPRQRTFQILQRWPAERQRGRSPGFFLQIIINFVPRVPPKLQADARC